MEKYFNNSDIRTFDLTDFVGRTMRFREFQETGISDGSTDEQITKVIVAYDVHTGDIFVIDIQYIKPF